jgi:DamX protein
MREERFRGRPWFVLIHSLYEDRAAAQQASETLPDSLARLDLWIRKLPAETELDVIDTSADQT